MNHEATRQRLLERLAEIRRLDSATGDDRRPVELDQQRLGRLSRMDALQQQAMARAAEARRGGEARRIAAALRRLEDGSYGDCVRCGEPINEQRLDSDPAAPLCIACAAG